MFLVSLRRKTKLLVCVPADNQNYRHNAKTHAVAFDDGHSGEQRKRLGGLCGHNNAFGKIFGVPNATCKVVVGRAETMVAHRRYSRRLLQLFVERSAFTNACNSTS